MNKGLIIAIVVIVLLITFTGLSQVITVPYNIMEKYTESEPYTDVETYTEKEPYTATEYKTESKPYTTEECETIKLVHKYETPPRCKREGIFGLGESIEEELKKYQIID